ncbi:type II secretion system protein M [Aliiglaciecola sp. LCG003]|uniref:type II secretion system protein M n=1 Tax=Aliiglaciecola sp. LCG003 TaxID=3053655 RepID=UPI002573A015|nr:type II secretion system protein M [Aliiglaciecola sp. LCG003]WJG09304.1 type II secretion system protein M [Aliiglaciecola sp. LCG003]
MKIWLEKYHQLTDREKILVVTSVVLIVIVLFYLLVWSPINSALATHQKTVEGKRDDMAWIEKNSNRAIQLRGSGGSKSVFTGSLPQAVNQSASRINIAISRMQPQGDELKVWVDQAPFNDVISWLQSMENSGIKIINVDLSEANAPGMVKVRSLQLGKS